MFGDAQSLLIGSIAASAAPMCVAIVSGCFGDMIIAGALAVLGGCRLYGMKAYQRHKAHLVRIDDLRKWEILYVVGASFHVTLMGMFCLVTFIQSDSEFGRVMSSVGAMAYFVGIPGRNFASNLLVNWLIVCGSVPMLAALFVAGGYFWLISIFVLLPFFAAMRNISFRLRGVYLDAVLRAIDVSLLADQFDAALNNMPHGLAMLNRDQRIVVINSRLNQLLKIRIDPRERDWTIVDLFTLAQKSGVLDSDQVRTTVANFLLQLQEFPNQELTFDLLDGRTLNVRCQPMSDGGAVFLFEDITERIVAQQRISQLARFDSLTGLPNRSEFLEQATLILNMRNPESNSAVMFVDLDQFKQVNDTLGHAIGDKLLCEAARQLLDQLRKQDLIGRFGGDEFVMLLNGLASREDAEATAARMIAQLSKPYQIGDHRLCIAASIGISFASKSNEEVGPLLRDADLALYQAKADGRGVTRVFAPEMEERVRTRRALEYDFREALNNSSFEVYYQPIYNLDKRAFTGCEALLRWNHPIRGWISPSVFVPLAEEMGLIGDLDDWVLQKACFDCAKWPPGFGVAVNVSAIHFLDQNLIKSVKQALKAAQLPASRLSVEITETALLKNLDAARLILSQLRRIGVSISLDDFGTGYSSLSYLHSLPLNRVKIDRSFLQGIDREGLALKLLDGIAKLCRVLGLEVVMEGVESGEELALVSETTPIKEIQGFYFSRPLPENAVLSLFEKQSRLAA